MRRWRSHFKSSKHFASYLSLMGSIEPEITVNTTGLYTVQVTDKNGCNAFAESSVLIFNGADAYTVTSATDALPADTVTYLAETTTAVGDPLFWYILAGGEIISANNEMSVTVVWTENSNSKRTRAVLNLNFIKIYRPITCR